MKVRLSICIPTFNRARLLDESLRSLVPQCEGKPVEICVSNNASADETAVVLARFREVRSMTQLFNIGIDRNILAAASMATGGYVLPIGDDELISTGGVDAILAGLRAQPDLLMLNGLRQGKPHLPRRLRGRSISDPVSAFDLLWDKMPLGGFAVRRDALARKYTDRYLGTYHAYSGAVWDYLLTLGAAQIHCMSFPAVEFREAPKAWAADAENIISREIPRWFDLIPPAYAQAVARSRRIYLRTWGNPRAGVPGMGSAIVSRALTLVPRWIIALYA